MTTKNHNLDYKSPKICKLSNIVKLFAARRLWFFPFDLNKIFTLNLRVHLCSWSVFLIVFANNGHVQFRYWTHASDLCDFRQRQKGYLTMFVFLRQLGCCRSTEAYKIGSRHCWVCATVWWQYEVLATQYRSVISKNLSRWGNAGIALIVQHPPHVELL
jgi:hypothetical protein